MQYFEGVEFFGALVVMMIPMIITRLFEKRIYWLSFFCSIFVAGMVFHSNPSSLIGLIVFIVTGYIFVQLSWRFRHHKKGMYALVFMATLFLILVKLSGAFSFPFIGFLGVSYMTFKVVQMILETYDGVIQERVKLFDYLQFLLFFPTMSSGPIDRSRRFNEDMHQVMPRAEYLELAGTGITRLLLGLVYKLVLASLIYQAMTNLPSGGFVWNTVQYMYSYSLYLFFDFAGYSLMAVGVSNLMGIQTPMNFNQPFRSVDIKDFWNRWHITLSTWLRDFVFSRIVMATMRKKLFKKRVHTAMLAFMLNMVLMGVWHGISWSYIVYGIYHGVLMATFELYQKKSKFYKKNKQKTWYKVLSWFVTMQLVMIGLLIFSGKPYEYIMKHLMQ